MADENKPILGQEAALWAAEERRMASEWPSTNADFRTIASSREMLALLREVKATPAACCRKAKPVACVHERAGFLVERIDGGAHAFQEKTDYPSPEGMEKPCRVCFRSRAAHDGATK